MNLVTLGNFPLHSISIASPICQEGQSERTFLIFAFSSQFFISSPPPLFPDFWEIFCCQEEHFAPPPFDPLVAMPLLQSFKYTCIFACWSRNLITFSMTCEFCPGGVLSTKVYPGTCRWNGSQNQPPGITIIPIQCKNWYKHGSYFQNFLKLARKWTQFHQSDTKNFWNLLRSRTILENNVKFFSKFCLKFVALV